MSLICVEYEAPSLGATSNQLWLDGCIGETNTFFLKKAKQKLQWLQKTVGPGSLSSRPSASKMEVPEKDLETWVPVRFPLIRANSRTGKFASYEDPSDRLKLKYEGIFLPVSRLFLCKNRTPTSLYKRVLLGSNPDYKSLFESPKYYVTRSKGRCLQAVQELGQLYPHAWLWKREYTTRSGDSTHLFLEARFYGIDSVISIYDRTQFSGVAFEIITRDPRYACIRSNVYVCSTHNNYISNIDGGPARSIISIRSPWSVSLTKGLQRPNIVSPQQYAKQVK